MGSKSGIEDRVRVRFTTQCDVTLKFQLEIRMMKFVAIVDIL